MTHTLSLWRPTWPATLLVGLAFASLALVYATDPPDLHRSPAPESRPASINEEIQRALASAGQPAAVADTAGVSIPLAAAGGISLAADGGRTLTLGMPASGTGRRAGVTTVYPGHGPANLVAVQPTAAGVRTLVRLAGPAAPERYAFTVTGANALRLQPSGAVNLLDRRGRELGRIAAPWARDATGRAVPTHYEIRGSALVQVVKHRHLNVSYPLVADPSVWTILKCAGSIIAAAVSIAIPGAKLIQLTKFIRAVGGIKDAARLLVGATTKAEKLKAIRSAVGVKSASAVAAALLGIPGIRDNCF